MEAPAELEPQAERGGPPLGHLGAAPGGEPGPRARPREPVGAGAALRSGPADGAESVPLERQRCGGAPPAGAAPPQGPPRVAGSPPPEEPGERGRGPAQPPGRGVEPGDGEAAADGGRHRRPAGSGCALRAPAPAPELGGGPGEAAAPKTPRRGARDRAPGGSPQPKRSAGPGGGGSEEAAAAPAPVEEEGGGGGGAAVALDPLEHAWMLSAADGRWDGLEGLLSSDPGLLAKRDFITGFTCLHWAAKHGRQEVLALLVNFALKHRLPVDINARTSGGYTALHLAAMHGRAEVVKLLVGAYDADVDARDYSGRKAAQYLGRGAAEEIGSLVGALDLDPREGGAGAGGGRWRLSRVLPSHLVAHRPPHGPEEGGDPHPPAAEGLAGGKAKEPSRKAPGGPGGPSGRIRPRLNRMRFRTQIVHTTPSFRGPGQPLEEGDEDEEEDEEEDHSLRGHSSCKLRPKSNVFG